MQSVLQWTEVSVPAPECPLSTIREPDATATIPGAANVGRNSEAHSAILTRTLLDTKASCRTVEAELRFALSSYRLLAACRGTSFDSAALDVPAVVRIGDGDDQRDARAMSVDYFVAVHEADWPTPAALNRCMADLNFPVTVKAPSALTQPLAIMPNTLGLVVMFEGEQVELEASVVKISPTRHYASRLRPDLPTREYVSPNGTTFTVTPLTGPNDFIPGDLNADLKSLDMKSPDYRTGDYVLSLSFHSSVVENRAGAFLMAGLIKCSNDLGFEFQSSSFGTDDFADSLSRAAADKAGWNERRNK